MFADIPEIVKWKIGYAADPALDMLLDKGKIAQIKVRELDARIHDLERNLEIVKMTRDALKEQYKVQ